MNCLRHLSQRPFLLRPSPLYASLRRRVSSTPAPRALAPGAPVPGLEGVYPPGKDDASRAPLVLPRPALPLAAFSRDLACRSSACPRLKS